MTIGLKLISAALAAGSMSDFLSLGNIEPLFKPNEIEQYKFVRDFAKKHGKLPTEETLTSHTGLDLVKHNENTSYYYDLLKKRHVQSELKLSMKKASDVFLNDATNPDKALEILAGTVMSLMTTRHQKQISDFRQAYDLLISEYVSQYNAEEGQRVMTGWPYLDLMTGGLTRGDMLSMVGRPAIGKTYQMLYSAHAGWDAANRYYLKTGELPDNASRLFVSMEMPTLQIQQRLAAMQAHVPMTKLKHAALGTQSLGKLKNALVNVSKYGAPFWVVDGNLTAQVEDIWMIARQLGVGGIWIDGAYLVKHPKVQDRYQRVAENADLMKKELSALCPVAASWQFARPKGQKSKKVEVQGVTMDLDDIGYTDVIGQVSTVVVGMFEENSIETLLRRLLVLLKGRNGESGRWMTHWNFEQMDFSQYVEQDVSELQFV